MGFSSSGASTSMNYTPPPRVDDGPRLVRDPSYPTMVRTSISPPPPPPPSRPYVPPEHRPGPDVQLPAYETQASLARKGYPQDMLSAVHPQSTPISYFEANRRNAQGQAAHAADPERAGTSYIREYQPNSYIVKADSNPAGSQALGHAHRREVPERSRWLFSKDDARSRITPGDNPRSSVQTYLDLPKQPNFVSDGRVAGGEKIELSRTFSGTPQLNAPRETIDYSNTSPIGRFFDWLRG